MRGTYICPSILSGDFARLESEAKKCMDNGADWLHLDVMDGHFVPNLTIGPVVVQSLRKHTSAFLDCHLMVSHPQQWLEMFHEAGADNFTFHFEAVPEDEIKDFVKKVNKTKMHCSIAIKPKTDPKVLFPILDDPECKIFMILGFGGQKFMGDMMPKGMDRSIKFLVELLHSKYPELNIQVDGGVAEDTIETVAIAGANSVVAGSSLFKAKDMKHSIEYFKSVLNKTLSTNK